MSRNEGGNRPSFSDARQTEKRLTEEHNSPPKKKKVGQNNLVNSTVDANDDGIVLLSATPLDIVQRLEFQDKRFKELSGKGKLTFQWIQYGKNRNLYSKLRV